MQAQDDTAEGTGVTDVAGQIDADPTAIVERIDTWVDTAMRMVPNMVVALVVVGVFWALGRLARRIAHRTAASQGRDDLGNVLGSFIAGALTLLGFALALTILAPSLGVGDLVASLGIGSVAIGFAFKDILQNWLAGLLLLIRQPFEIGDQIVVDGYEGTVEHIETRATLIRTYDGQQVVIPNADVYTNAVTVRTERDIRRSQYDVGVGYSTDLDEAQAIALDTLKGTEGVLADPAPEVLVWDLAASGVVLRLRWWTESLRTDVVHVHARVIQNAKAAFDAAEIDIPYETRVVMLHDQTDPDTDAAGLRPRPREEAEPDARTTF